MKTIPADFKSNNFFFHCLSDFNTALNYFQVGNTTIHNKLKLINVYLRCAISNIVIEQTGSVT